MKIELLGTWIETDTISSISSIENIGLYVPQYNFKINISGEIKEIWCNALDKKDLIEVRDELIRIWQGKTKTTTAIDFNTVRIK